MTDAIVLRKKTAAPTEPGVYYARFKEGGTIVKPELVIEMTAFITTVIAGVRHENVKSSELRVMYYEEALTSDEYDSLDDYEWFGPVPLCVVET